MAYAFGQETKRRKRRAKKTVAGKKAAAEALALLGQSQIANNLNQLAYCPE
jgi:4'-phosphopantetheinyl transferase EntD